MRDILYGSCMPYVLYVGTTVRLYPFPGERKRKEPLPLSLPSALLNKGNEHFPPPPPMRAGAKSYYNRNDDCSTVVTGLNLVHGSGTHET